MYDALKKYVAQALYVPALAAPARSPADRWAIALAAMYSRVNRNGNDRLAPQTLMTGVSTESSLAMLKAAWDVDGHDKAVGVLDWLAQVGHRGDPDFAAPGDPEAVQDLLAWDIARRVMVARHAFHARHISEAEAWAHLRAAAHTAQQSFPSWQEYGRRFLRGRARWNGERDKALDAAIDFLLQNQKSPWRQLDWQTPLRWPESDMPATSR